MFKAIFGSPDNHPYNQALGHFRKLSDLSSSDPAYITNLIAIIRLCQLAIRQSTADGDSHILLANAYLLAALAQPFGQVYPFALSHAAAAIFHWKNVPMHSNAKQIGEKIFSGVIDQLTQDRPQWMRSLPTRDIERLHADFYSSALNPEMLDRLSRLIAESERDHLVLFAQYRDQGNWPKALEQLQLALSADQNNPALHMLLGTTYGELEVWDEAIRAFQRVLRLQPERAGVRIALATAFLSHGDPDRAIEEFLIGLASEPKHAHAHFLLGRSYYKKGRLQDALGEFLLATQLEPSEAFFHFALGNFYGSQGMYEDAISEFQTGIGIEPGNAGAHLSLARCYEELGHRKLATTEYQIASQLGSKEALSHL